MNGRYASTYMNLCRIFVYQTFAHFYEPPGIYWFDAFSFGITVLVFNFHGDQCDRYSSGVWWSVHFWISTHTYSLQWSSSAGSGPCRRAGGTVNHLGIWYTSWRFERWPWNDVCHMCIEFLMNSCRPCGKNSSIHVGLWGFSYSLSREPLRLVCLALEQGCQTRFKLWAIY